MRQLLIIVIVFLAAIVLDMPRKITVSSRTFYRPTLNLTSWNIPFERDLEFKLGLDLQGGSHLVYRADMAKIPTSDRDSAIGSTRENIERRVNLLGVSESLVQVSQIGDEYRLIVELPGIKDVNQAMSVIGQTAFLEFRELPATSSGQASDFIPTDLSGSDLKIASVQFGQGDNSLAQEPTVSIEFTPAGTEKFATITKRNVDRPLAIFLDNRIVTAPVVQQEITAGRAVISGDFTVDSAKSLAIQLNAGALPVPISVVEQKNIGATLGAESVLKSLVAGLVGLVVIWIFMIANYGLKGVVADIALLAYVLLSLALFKLVPVTMTLAGIAGFILSIGMAVDANILIFERIKEEIRWGRSKSAALELGFYRAWNSIRDSNSSSLITAGILFWLGSGSVRGFALTLILGILVSLFTSIIVTRSLLRLL